MKIAIGADHGGFELKRSIVASFADAEFVDVGCTGTDACDFPDYANAVAEKVALGEVDFGVLVCRTGMGMTMAANRFLDVRAALCLDTGTAELARRHNGANVLCMGADKVNLEQAIEATQKATELNPQEESYFYNMAMCYQTKKAWANALNAIESCLALDRRDADHLSLAYQIYRRNHLPEKAREVLPRYACADFSRADCAELTRGINFAGRRVEG